MGESSSESGAAGPEPERPEAPERRDAPEQGSPAAPAGGSAAGRVAWTLLPAGVWIAGTLAPLPGVDAAALPGSDLFTSAQVSLLLFGVTPLLTGYVLVEGAAALAPGWRPLRRTRRGRGKLTLAALVVTLLVAAFQGWGFLKLLDGYGALVSGSMLAPVLSLVAATAVLWAALQTAEARGLGSPLAVVTGLGVVWDLRAVAAGPWGSETVTEVPPLVLFGGMAALAMGMTLAVLKKPAREEGAAEGVAEGVAMTVRIPPSGLVPLLAGGLALNLIRFGAAQLPGMVQLARVPWVAVAGALFVGLSWVLYLPSRVGAAWAGLFERGTGAGTGGDVEPGAQGDAESGAPGEEATRDPGAGSESEGAGRERGTVPEEDAKVKAAYAPPKVLEAGSPLPRSGTRGDPVSPERLAVWTGRARRLLVRAMLPAVAYLGLVMWPEWPVVGRPLPVQTASLVGLCVAAAAVLDVVAEARFRRAHREVAAVAIEQRLFVVDAALAALQKEGIPAVARNEGVRTLLSVLAPFAPVEILVPSEDAERARGRIAAVADVEPGEETGGRKATGKTAGPRKPGAGKAKGTKKRRKKEAMEESGSA